MTALPIEKKLRSSPKHPFTVLELKVANHPGVMSHICNLFARRAFNLEGILCMPVEDGAESRIWLRVHEDERLEQLIKQIDKLWDVREVRHNSIDSKVFKQLEDFFKEG
jgi:acetolactate synthase I/III small subunit